MIVATPAWITGQSYMISACLTAGITSILLEGSPVAPSPLRFANIIERHRVTIFKAGSTFLRQVMADPTAIIELKKHDMSSLRAASFCAEPVSPTVHSFAIQYICSHYVNSYWASEHGGIVFTRPFLGSGGASQVPDARCEPVPWIQASVMVTDEHDNLRNAKDKEHGEIILHMCCPFPSLARTIWGDKGQFEKKSLRWRGNLNAFCNTYFRTVTSSQRRNPSSSSSSSSSITTTTNEAANKKEKELLFVQGDWAQKHKDGSFSFHGRSDDVLNVGGQRIGTG